VTALETVALYEPKPPDPKVQLNLRVPRSTKDGIEAIVRLWTSMAVARGEEHEHIDLSYVARRLLKVGIEGAFDEVGGIPQSEDDWEKVEAAIVKSAKSKR
jgi:hypothetical protein